MRTLQKFFLVLVLSISLPAYAATDAFRQWILWETQSNGVSTRSADVVELKHFEVPLEFVEANFEKGRESEVLKFFTFTREGQQWVRWMINPEDTKWAPKLEAWFKENNVPYRKGQYYKAWKTASRRYGVMDPATGVKFSVKVSTNATGGAWTDKQQPVDDAEQVRFSSDFVKGVSKTIGFDHIVPLGDVGEFSIPGADQAMLVRELGDLAPAESKGKHFYLPGFSALHETTGKEIAKLNGSNNPAEFWTVHYAEAVGRALGELAAKTGLTYDSPHSQNFLIELDANFKPTGRIVMRDFVDTYAWKDFFEGISFNDFIQRWEKGNILGYVDSAIGFLHGNKPPSWIGKAEYQALNTGYHKEFEATFKKITGVNLAAAGKTYDRSYEFGYNSKSYPPIAKKNIARYFSALAKKISSVGGIESGVFGTPMIGCKNLQKMYANFIGKPLKEIAAMWEQTYGRLFAECTAH